MLLWGNQRETPGTWWEQWAVLVGSCCQAVVSLVIKPQRHSPDWADQLRLSLIVLFFSIFNRVIVNSSNTMAVIIWLTLTTCKHQRYNRVQRRRAVVTIWDAVVETLTTLSNFQLLGQPVSHVSISFSCIQTGAALNPGWISRTLIRTVSLTSLGRTGPSGRTVRRCSGQWLC